MNTPTVLITGALTGIGRATALAFGREGARVVVSWPRHTSASSRAAFTLASIRTRSRNIRRWLDGQAIGG
jgi:NAD(P)-dependent dehydrogenase (short-subunit alcohol dehydrogenase family)